MRKSYSLRLLSLLVAIFLFIQNTFAQSVVTGTVTDQSGKGISGVTVTVKGTSTATQTDENGRFSCQLLDQTKESPLEVSSQYLIYATGYRYTPILSLLEPFKPLLQLDSDGLPLRNDDYSLLFRSDAKFHIFAHATGDRKFGFTEGGMTNLAARSSRIVASIQAAQCVFA